MLRKLIHKFGKKELLRYTVVVLGLVGMLCILFAPDSSENLSESAAKLEETEETPKQYCERIQEELSALLSSCAGVGSVKVLVTVNGSEEYIYATEGDSLVTDEQVKQSSSYVTVGGSKSQALVESVAYPGITGVVVACEGGDRSTVRETVYHAVSVACGISTAQIYVTKLNAAP